MDPNIHNRESDPCVEEGTRDRIAREREATELVRRSCQPSLGERREELLGTKSVRMAGALAQSREGGKGRRETGRCWGDGTMWLRETVR